jgi:hypothetical protein
VTHCEGLTVSPVESVVEASPNELRNFPGVPCESRLQKWVNHPDGIYGLCKWSREMDLGFLVVKPSRG